MTDKDPHGKVTPRTGNILRHAMPRFQRRVTSAPLMGLGSKYDPLAHLGPVPDGAKDTSYPIDKRSYDLASFGLIEESAIGPWLTLMAVHFAHLTFDPTLGGGPSNLDLALKKWGIAHGLPLIIRQTFDVKSSIRNTEEDRLWLVNMAAKAGMTPEAYAQRCVQNSDLIF